MTDQQHSSTSSCVISMFVAPPSEVSLSRDNLISGVSRPPAVSWSRLLSELFAVRGNGGYLPLVNTCLADGFGSLSIWTTTTTRGINPKLGDLITFGWQVNGLCDLGHQRSNIHLPPNQMSSSYSWCLSVFVRVYGDYELIDLKRLGDREKLYLQINWSGQHRKCCRGRVCYGWKWSTW